MKLFRYDSFTLIEISVTLILVAVLAGIALPQYFKARERTLVEQTKLNLKTIHAANSVYEERSGQYWPPDNSSYLIDSINTDLGLNIIPPSSVQYSCSGTDGSAYSCTAVRINGGQPWSVSLDQNPISSTNPQCTVFCP